MSGLNYAVINMLQSLRGYKVISHQHRAVLCDPGKAFRHHPQGQVAGFEGGTGTHAEDKGAKERLQKQGLLALLRREEKRSRMK
jgi:hypothetical protein